MLARYRRMRDALADIFGWARFSLPGPAFDEFAASGDWSAAVRAAIADDVPPGLVVVSVATSGKLSAQVGPPRPAISGGSIPVDVVLDSTADTDLVVTVAGTEVPVPAGLQTLDLDADTPTITLTCGSHQLEVTGAVVPTPAATLRLTSPHGARWSVTDATGGRGSPTTCRANGT